MPGSTSLLRIPPFPGSRAASLAAGRSERRVAKADLDDAIAAIRKSGAAGTFWGRRPSLPDLPYLLVRSRIPVTGLGLENFDPTLPIVVWTDRPDHPEIRGRSFHLVGGECDPWHMVRGAIEVVADADDELALVAAIADVPVRPVGKGPFVEVAKGRRGLTKLLRGPALASCSYVDPFWGGPLTLRQAIDLCSFWKELIDCNRTIEAAIGFASWKRSTVEPLLWSGSEGPSFGLGSGFSGRDKIVAIWKSRVSQRMLEELERSGATQVEVEDGFLRSAGLGAECVPPLSIVVDQIGIYFDPSRESQLERLLQQGEFPPELLRRAQRLRRWIIRSGISKYAAAEIRRPGRDRGERHVLVIGQVDDDRSVRCGGGGVQSNLELIRRVRLQCPGARIIYRPHPDVQAGHRIGRVDRRLLAELDVEERSSGSIAQAIEDAEEVHVNTSLAGFEALMRGKRVTTYGVPFYAGWGLTTDLGRIPCRRSATRSLDELVAATLLQYPRYLDPVTGLPCTAETLVGRLARGEARVANGVMVRLRRLQGLLKRFWAIGEELLA